jgi:hypothetical protein
MSFTHTWRGRAEARAELVAKDVRRIRGKRMEPDTNSYRLGDTISFTATVEHNFVMDHAQAVLQLQEESPFPDPRRLVLFAVEITEQKTRGRQCHDSQPGGLSGNRRGRATGRRVSPNVY